MLSTTPARAEDLNSRSWSVTELHSVYNYSPTKGEVENFVNKLVDADWNMPLCSFKFVDVFDGAYRLVATLDVNGRHSCNKLVVIEKQRSHFNIVNSLQVLAADNVGDLLQDVDNDNSPEIIVTTTWSRPEAGHCTATWQKIYKWRDGRFTNQSVSFTKYYKDRRDQLIAGLKNEKDFTCHQMEIDKITRLLGSPNAGFDHAVAWMKSSDESLRRKATTVFADIGDAASKKNLALLVKDPDPLTAKSAQMYLDAPPELKE